MATIVNKSNGKLSTFDMEGKKTSKGKVNALVPLSRQDSAINEVRENIKTNTPVNFTGPIVGNAAVTRAKSYEDSGVGVYLEFDNSNYSSTISTQTTVQFAPKTFTFYQGRKGQKENRKYNYYTMSRTEAERDYGPIVEEKELSLEGYLRKHSEFDWTPEYIALEKEFRELGNPAFDILDNSKEGMKNQNNFFAFLESKGYKGYTELIEGKENMYQENPYAVEFSPKLSSLEQPTVDESAVVVDIPKDLMNILTGNVTNKATSSQNNPITPDQQNQEEDAASCGIK